MADKPKSPENVFLFSRRQDVECFRPMNVFFRLQIEHISAHCLTHQPLVQQSSRLQGCLNRSLLWIKFLYSFRSLSADKSGTVGGGTEEGPRGVFDSGF